MGATAQEAIESVDDAADVLDYIPSGHSIYHHTVYYGLALGCLTFISAALVTVLHLVCKRKPCLFKIATLTHYILCLLAFIGFVLSLYVVLDIGMRPETQMLIGVAVFSFFTMVGSAFYGCCLWNFDKAQNKHQQSADAAEMA